MYWEKRVHLVTLHWQEQFKHGCQKARETQLFIQLLVPLTRTEPTESKNIKDKILKNCLWALQTAFPFISEGIGCLFPSVQMVVVENSMWILITCRFRKCYQLHNLNSMYNMVTNILLPWLQRWSNFIGRILCLQISLFSSVAVNGMCYLIQNR